MSAKIFLALLLVGLKLCSGAVLPLTDAPNRGTISNTNATTAKPPPTTNPKTRITLKTTTTKPTTTTLKTTTTKPTTTTTLKTTTTKPTTTTTLKTTTTKPTTTTTLKTTTTKPTTTTTLKTTKTKPTRTTAKKTTTTKPTTTTTKKTTTTKPTATPTKKTTAARLFTTKQSKTTSITTTTPPETTTEPTTATETTTIIKTSEIPTTTAANFCTYNGKTYAINEEFRPDPCSVCWCQEGGHHLCAMMSCMACESGQPIYIPGQCCPGCDTTPFELQSTTPGYCEYDGNIYPVGEQFTPDPCTFCTCEEGGQTMCAKMSCPSCPSGTIYMPDQCCPICHPERVLCWFDGDFYNVGDSFHTDPCTFCTCGYDGQNMCSSYDCQPCEGEAVYVDGQCCPQCQPIPTTTPTLCEANGQYYAVGESYMPDPCQHCTCGEGGQPWCMRYRCEPCDGQPIYVPGQCCPECQQTTTTEMTPPLPPTTTTIPCIHNDISYAVGDSYWSDPCTQCYCQDNGPSCAMRDCAQPVCNNYYFVEGECCPRCQAETPSYATPCPQEETTTPTSHCVEKGKYYQVGERFSDGPCGFCYCAEGGQSQCVYAGCIPCEGEMVNIEGQCCPECIPMTPMTPEMPTTTIMSCEYNGNTYAVGESFFPDPCSYCTCEADGQPVCMIGDCPYCEGMAVHVDGQCCPECHPIPPTPSHCREHGEIYQLGESFYPDPCTYCYCGESGQVQCAYGDCPTCYGYTVYEPGQCCPKCYPVPPMPTSTPAPSCRSNGATYEIGESYWSDPCTMCTCDSKGPMCYKRDCDRPECYDYYVIEGECCPQCRPDKEITTTPTSYETPCPTEEVVEEYQTTATAN